MIIRLTLVGSHQGKSEKSVSIYCFSIIIFDVIFPLISQNTTDFLLVGISQNPPTLRKHQNNYEQINEIKKSRWPGLF
jgi:hypothetical protein